MNSSPEPFLRRLVVINMICWGIIAASVVYAVRNPHLADASADLEATIPVVVRWLLVPRQLIELGMTIVTMLAFFVAPAALLGATTFVGVFLTEAANHRFWLKDR